ncbi:hypothetical protein FORC066_1408 [Yersinia enterocolitica]|nr:hypothetical protein FORC065_3038 [Yersinia enterocolitica]UXD28623.1 hypothetical protein FORC066_1408 [Yersinia enterocolitica]
MEFAFSANDYWHDYCTSIYGNVDLWTLRVVQKTNALCGIENQFEGYV